MSQAHPKKRRLSEGDSDLSRPKRPRRMEGGRFHVVSDPLSTSPKPAWFDLDRSFQIPDPASTDPLEMPPFDLDFFNLPSIPSDVVSSTLGEFITSLAKSLSADRILKQPPATLLNLRMTFLPYSRYRNLIYYSPHFPPSTPIGPNS